MSASSLQIAVIEPAVIETGSLQITHMEVYGMCCHSEVALVHKKLGVLPGVLHVRVNTGARCR